jgi:hypothetical protein
MSLPSSSADWAGGVAPLALKRSLLLVMSRGLGELRIGLVGQQQKMMKMLAVAQVAETRMP